MLKGTALFEAATRLLAAAEDLAKAATEMDLGRGRAGAGRKPVFPLSIREVARRLSLPPSSVHALIQRNELPAVRRGKKLRVLPRDVDAYLAANRPAEVRRR